MNYGSFKRTLNPISGRAMVAYILSWQSYTLQCTYMTTLQPHRALHSHCPLKWKWQFWSATWQLANVDLVAKKYTWQYLRNMSDPRDSRAGVADLKRGWQRAYVDSRWGRAGWSTRLAGWSTRWCFAAAAQTRPRPPILPSGREQTTRWPAIILGCIEDTKRKKDNNKRQNDNKTKKQTDKKTNRQRANHPLASHYSRMHWGHVSKRALEKTKNKKRSL